MPTPASSVRDLDMWKLSHDFVQSVYKVTAQFPIEERFGLAQQFRRAAVSIPANLSEGFRRRSAAEKARFSNIAEGSLEECRYYCLLAKDLGFPYEPKWEEELSVIDRMISAYISRSRGRTSPTE